MPTNAQLDEPLWFPTWPDRLAESELEELRRESFGITIRWYLSFCKRSRVRATKRTARDFIEVAREEKGASEAELERWREGIRWFFREGRAEMRGVEVETDLGHRGSPQSRDPATAGRRPSQKTVEHPAPRPSPLGRGEGVDAVAGWREAVNARLWGSGRESL